MYLINNSKTSSSWGDHNKIIPNSICTGNASQTSGNFVLFKLDNNLNLDGYYD
jgi:hypothetical protein